MGEARGGELASAAGATVGIGSAATATAVAACCSGPALGPLVVAMLGAGGAVALEGLRPKAGPLLVVSALAIGVSFWLSLRARRARPSCQSPIGALTILGLALGAGLGRAHGAALGKIRMKPIAALFILCSVLVACAARASSNTMQYVTLNSANQPFRDAFNRHRDDVRIVELVSPTCPACLDGVSKIQRVLFSTEPSRRLAGFTIWVPMLGGKAGNVPDAMTLAPDPRVAHYWDESNDLGIAYERVLPVSTGPAWDVYLIYAPGIVWNGADPPKSSFWMHQLAIANAPHLDVALFADRARAMFAHAH